jgi:chromosome partitioning protein
MPVISFLNQKGGVGKTTLSLHVAYQLAQRKGGKESVLVIDGDPQGSSLDWAAQREAPPPFTVIGLPKPVIHREIAALSAGYDWTVIDGPPRSNDIAISAISASDLVLIPVQPSPFDIWAAKEIVKAIGDVMSYKPGLKAAFVINRLIPNTTLAQEVMDALETFEGIPVMTTVIHSRTEYAKAPRSGMTATETEPQGNAAANINSLVKDILRTLGVKA